MKTKATLMILVLWAISAASTGLWAQEQAIPKDAVTGEPVTMKTSLVFTCSTVDSFASPKNCTFEKYFETKDRAFVIWLVPANITQPEHARSLIETAMAGKSSGVAAKSLYWRGILRAGILGAGQGVAGTLQRVGETGPYACVTQYDDDDRLEDGYNDFWKIRRIGSTEPLCSSGTVYVDSSMKTITCQ